jgi:hypothetical protein
MPDYLGKDQRTVKGDEEKEDKPIQGNFLLFLDNICTTNISHILMLSEFL